MPEAGKSFAARELHGSAGWYAKSFNPPIMRRQETLAHNAIRWFARWPSRAYPGIYRSVQAVLQRHVTPRCIRNWQAGGTMPGWAAARFADYIESECLRGLEIVAELRSHERFMASRVHHLAGYHARRAQRSEEMPR